MKEAALLKKIAHLESINDLMEAELISIDTLMRDLGFTYGIQTVKETAHEIIDEEKKAKKKRLNKGI